MRVVRARSELSQEGRADGAPVRHPRRHQHAHLAPGAHDGSAGVTLFPAALARYPGLPCRHPSAARGLPERRPGGGHRALQSHDRSAGAPRTRAISVDSPPLQGTHRGLPGLLRSGGAAPRVSELEGTSFDLLVVGGGINGTGIARDAAGRGLSVLLVEQDDLAAHTSSASTKLIHGGLRYLEEFHFALVRKALIEREVLLRSAPHIMRPLHFIMPHAPHLRPAWMIRAGLFLYDHLAHRAHLAASGSVDLRTHIAGAALKSGYQRGFVYSDGQTDDARLVVLNALDGAQRGAIVLTRTRC